MEDLSLENSTLMFGDCLERMKEIPDRSIDMILCDLPYGVLNKNNPNVKWDCIIPFDDMWNQYNRLIKDNRAIVLTASQPFTTALIASNMAMFKYCWVWEKPQGVDPFMAKIRPLNNYEDIVVFSKGTTRYYPQMVDGNPYKIVRDRKSRKHELTGTIMKQTSTDNKGFRYPTRILKVKQERGLHPTQKPVALLEYLIKTYTDEEMIVLDNCMGSGSTGVACVNTNRKFIGIEMDEKYFDISCKRIEDALREPSLFK